MTNDQLVFETQDQGTTTQHRLMYDGEQVSQLWVGDLMMRIGSCAVRMGGIGGVGTDRTHRHKGYARTLLENCNRWMAESGYDCALLFGIPNFYDRFGYAVCLPDCRYEIPTRAAERVQRKLIERPFAPDDRPALEAIYASNNKDLTGSLVRNADTPWFSNGYWGSASRKSSVFVTGDGEIVAYSVRNDEEENLTVCEAGATRPAYFDDIIRSAAEIAIEKRVEKIVFQAPPDSRIGHALSKFGAIQTLIFPYERNGMGRILNLDSFFEKTLPEWTHRAQSAPGLPENRSLLVETDIGRVTLTWNGKTITLNEDHVAAGTIHLSQAHLMQLAMGYHDADTILTLPEVDSTGDIRLSHALFPRRLGHMWQADHF